MVLSAAALAASAVVLAFLLGGVVGRGDGAGGVAGGAVAGDAAVAFALVFALAFVATVTAAAAVSSSSSFSVSSLAASFASSGVGGCFAEFCGHGFLGDFFFEEVLDGGEEWLVFLADEGDGAAVLAGACCASDAVDVVFFVVGHVVVDDELYVVDVDASCYDVCGYEDVDLSGLEAVHDVVALFLEEVAVHGFGVVAAALEGDGYVLGVYFLSDEDDDSLRLLLFEEVFDDLHLLCLVADVCALSDAFGGFVEGDFDFCGVGEDGVCEFYDFVGHGG